MAKKKLKRKLARQVLAGKITVDEARSRLGRRLSQQTANKAWSTWPESVSLPRPAVIDENYVLEAVRARITVPAPASAPAVTKKRKTARPGPVPARQQVLNKAFADDAGVPPGAYRPAPLPPVVHTLWMIRSLFEVSRGYRQTCTMPGRKFSIELSFLCLSSNI